MLLVDACSATPAFEIDAVLDDETVALPAELVDLTPACSILARWDGRYDLDRAGPLLWREVLNRFSSDERTTAGPLFSDEFDPLQPTLSPAVPTDDSTALLAALARAVQTLTKAGFPLDSTLGAAQFTERSGTRIPIHGGTDADGVTNVVQWSGTGSSTETTPSRSDAVSPNSALRGEGFPVNFGTSFLMTVDYTGDQVQAWAILTYGQTDDRGVAIVRTANDSIQRKKLANSGIYGRTNRRRSQLHRTHPRSPLTSAAGGQHLDPAEQQQFTRRSQTSNDGATTRCDDSARSRVSPYPWRAQPSIRFEDSSGYQG